MTDAFRELAGEGSGGSLRLSRRGLLQAGMFGSALLWAGGALASQSGRAASAAEGMARSALSPKGEEILRAIAPAVLGPLLPAAGTTREAALEAGMAALDDYIAHLSLPLQQEIDELFATLSLWPTRLFLVGTLRRWQDASLEDVDSFLRSARHSHFLLLRRVYAFLQSMVVLAWFDQPRAWEAVGYPGPPVVGSGSSGNGS